MTAAFPVADGADSFADGELVLVGDPGDPFVFLALSAARIQEAGLERLQQLAGGMTVLGLGEDRADRLGLQALGAGQGLALAAPVDAARPSGGGWSTHARAHTIRVCADPASRAEDLTVPGHVHTARLGLHSTPAAAAALQLADAAGPSPAVVLAAVSDRDGAAVDLRTARSRTALRRLPRRSSAEIRGQALARRARGVVDCDLPTAAGEFRALVLDDTPAADPDRGSVIALVHGDPAARRAPLIHVHAACLLGDAFGSLLCDCRERLHAARAEILAAGAGIVVYVKPGSADAGRRYHCARESPVDLAPVIALLRACGIDASATSILEG